jgi:hypothetical protein
VKARNENATESIAMKPMSKGLWIGTIMASWAVCIVLASAGYVTLGIAEDRGEGDPFRPLLVAVAFGACVLAVACAVLGIVLGMVIVYRMWAVLQDDGETWMTPGLAVGLLFVPFVNLYWAFRVYPGWAREYNRYIQRHGIRACRKSPGLGMIVAIFNVLGPVLFWAPLYILSAQFFHVVFLIEAIKGINAVLTGERTRQPNGYADRCATLRPQGLRTNSPLTTDSFLP